MDLLPRSQYEFREKDYWDNFFKKRGRIPFEWYGNYADLCEHFSKYIKTKDRILVAGCGNSKLSLEMYNVGYRNLHNVDISDVVIRQMSQSHPDMKWSCMDLRNMEMEDNSYSVILDKGTTDALLVDESDAVLNDVHQMFEEGSRVLCQGGRWVLVSLLQPYVARVVLSWFHEAGWMIRVCHCVRTEDSEDSDRAMFPVFVVVATKLKLFGGNKPILEINFTKGLNKRIDTLEMVLSEVAAVQKFTVLQHRLGSLSLTSEDDVSVELVNADTQKVRFTLYVVDKLTCKRDMAVFIVPLGRELEWLFGSLEGRHELARSAGFGRLLVVHLHRDQHYDNIKTVQDELSPNIMTLAPADMPKNFQIPFLSVDNSLGHCVTVHESCSSISGEIRVEDAEGKSGLTRKLIFLSNSNAIQSEVKLNKSRPKGKHKQSKQVVCIDEVMCEHHCCMIGGLSLLPESSAIKALLIGVGGGALASYLLKNYPKISLNCVELDGEVVRIAHDWFHLPKAPRLNMHVMDGIEFVSESSKRGDIYDIVIVDVDSKDLGDGLTGPPKSFLQPDFLNQIKSILSRTGIFMVNLACRNKNLLQEYLSLLQTHFTDVLVYKIPDKINQVVYCLLKSQDADKATRIIKSRMAEIKNIKTNHGNLCEMKTLLKLPIDFKKYHWFY